MFGSIRNKYEWLFPFGSVDWLKSRPNDLGGPHPKRLRTVHFKFLLDGQELYCGIPLPLYQHDPGLPTWGRHRPEVLGWWDRSGVEPAFLITQDMLGQGGTEVQDLFEMGSCNLINNYWFWYTGGPRWPRLFGELKIGVRISHYFDQLNVMVKPHRTH